AEAPAGETKRVALLQINFAKGNALKFAIPIALLAIAGAGIALYSLNQVSREHKRESLSAQQSAPVKLSAQQSAPANTPLEEAAAQGDASAMYRLGLLYEMGQGVAQDYDKAREWFEKAAAKGDGEAMYSLGRFYETGKGVARDYVKAREWYEKAADKGDQRAKTNLDERLIQEAAGAGRYAEALQLQEALAAKQEAAETEREGKPGKETARALDGLAWRALFAREFTKALTVADRAHALLPDDLIIETNRAHALMFKEQKKEAKALYLAYKGKSLGDGQLWEQAIAEDFAEFRNAGLTHPMM